MKLEVGQLVYLKPVNNEARYDKEIKTVKITKIGRKYFTVSDCCYRFNINTMCADFGNYITGFIAYTSLTQIDNENKIDKLNRKFKYLFEHGNKLTLSQLEQIDNIIQ